MFKSVTWFGYIPGGLIILLLLCFILIRFSYTWEAAILLLTPWIILVVNIFKNFFAQPRPTADQIGFTPVIAHGASYPSGHAVFSAAVYGFMLLLALLLVKGTRRNIFSITLIALIILILLSRVFLGAHFLSDVIGGLLLGLSWSLALGAAYSVRQLFLK